MPDWGCGGRSCRPVKVLRGIPNWDTYRWKLIRKWNRKGYQVRFA